MLELELYNKENSIIWSMSINFEVSFGSVIKNISNLHTMMNDGENTHEIKMKKSSSSSVISAADEVELQGSLVMKLTRFFLVVQFMHGGFKTSGQICPARNWNIGRGVCQKTATIKVQSWHGWACFQFQVSRVRPSHIPGQLSWEASIFQNVLKTINYDSSNHVRFKI